MCVTRDGSVYTWGHNDEEGQLGVTDVTSVKLPMQAQELDMNACNWTNHNRAQQQMKRTKSKSESNRALWN